MTINLKVVDLSHHNPVTSFQEMYDFGIRGVILKATQGTSFFDKTCDARRKAAADVGLLVGFYHFATGDDVAEQVDHFLDKAAPEDGQLVALDYEPNAGNQMNIAGAREFLKAVEAQLGRKAVLYSGNLIKETLGDKPDEFFGSHRLWLAQYGPVPRVPAAWSSAWLWQFSGDGVNSHGLHVPGITGQLDLNSYAGSDDDLAAEWAS